VTLSELKYIVVLAREKHFDRADGRVDTSFVSQPRLSLPVKKAGGQAGVVIYTICQYLQSALVPPIGFYKLLDKANRPLVRRAGGLFEGLS
jgi:LysR family transcriptional regulator, hydrogen peroxide-inducible genes activator